MYSYAYSVYSLFLNISTAGIPIAISKIISEYNTLEMYEAKEKAYKIGRNFILIISCIAFFLLFVFAEEFANLIIGEIKGGNTLQDVGFVIKSVSFCLLIIPFLSVSKGYMQGHKYITSPSISQVIEQIVRIAVILMGSYIVINILNKSVTLAVGVSVFGAFIGGLVAFIYIRLKIYKNKSSFKTKDETKQNEITTKEIIKKISTYAIPLIIVTIATDIYSLTDMSLVIRTSYKLGYTAKESETIASIITTWAPKICMIINAVAMGMGTSLIPHMVSSFTKKNIKSTNKKFNQAINIMLVTTLPLAVGIAFLSTPIYTMFYGSSEYGSLILRYTAISSFFASMYLVISMSLQSLNKFKVVYMSSILGFITNALMDIPMMYLFKHLGLHSFYGAIAATILGYVVSYTISTRKLKKELNFNYKEIINTIKRLIIPGISLTLVLIILSLIINVNNTGRLKSLIICIPFAIIGGITYILITYKTGLLNDTLGEEYINKILKKLSINKKVKKC